MIDKNEGILPGCDLKEEDCKEFKVICRREVTHYYVTLKNKGGRCPHRGSYVTKVKELKERILLHDEGVLIHYKARRLLCCCGKTFQEEDPFAAGRRKITSCLRKKILLFLKRYNHTFLETAQRYGLSVTEVTEIFDTHVQIKRKPLRRVISIDEFYFSRKSSRKYAFMILGLNGEILDILRSRKKYDLLNYFARLPSEEREKVLFVTMDMNAVYKEVIERRLPNACICIDSFHVLTYIQQCLDEVHLKVLNRYNGNRRSDEYYLLKSKRYVLFREDLKEEAQYNHHFRFPMSDIDYLSRILKIDKELTEAYRLAKRYYYFNHYWQETGKKGALSFLERYIDDCILSGIPSFEKAARTLQNWKEEIANSFIPYSTRNGEIIRLSNGRIEGKNSYIKKMIRLANGYSNFERFRNRVMYCENLHDSYSEDELPNTIRRKRKKDRK